jgi:hypothetical protein
LQGLPEPLRGLAEPEAQEEQPEGLGVLPLARVGRQGEPGEPLPEQRAEQEVPAVQQPELGQRAVLAEPLPEQQGQLEQARRLEVLPLLVPRHLGMGEPS